MLSIIFNHTNYTLFELAFNETDQVLFSMPHQMTFDAVENIIELFNRTFRHRDCIPQESCTTVSNKSDLLSIPFIIGFMLILLTLLFVFIGLVPRIRRAIFQKDSKQNQLGRIFMSNNSINEPNH